MANDYLRLKWKTILEANDLNKDGFLTLEDANIFSDRFIEHHGMKGEKAKKLKQDFRDFYSNMFMLNEKEKMTSTRYVQVLEEKYVDLGKEAFHQLMVDVLGSCLEVLDANNDGVMSKEELVIAMKCWGIEQLQEEFVQSFTQFKAGSIRNDDFRDAWVAYFTNDDDKNVDSLEKPVITALGVKGKL